MFRDDYIPFIPSTRTKVNKKITKNSYPTIDEVNEFNAILHGDIVKQCISGQGLYFGYEIERNLDNEINLPRAARLSSLDKVRLKLSKLSSRELKIVRAKEYWDKEYKRREQVRQKACQLDKVKSRRILKVGKAGNPLAFRHQGSFVLFRKLTLTRLDYQVIESVKRIQVELNLSSDEAIRKLAWLTFTGKEN